MDISSTGRAPASRIYSTGSDAGHTHDISDVADWVRSRGSGDLVANGTGFLGNNYNWGDRVRFVGTDAPTGASGCFEMVTPGEATTLVTEEMCPVVASNRYELSFAMRQENAASAGNPDLSAAYTGFAGYYADGAAVDPRDWLWRTGTTTTLAQPLQPGDSYVYLTSTSNWYDPGGTASHYASIVFWDYIDGLGRQWPAETYSKWWATSAYKSIDGPGGRLVLDSPWEGQTWPAGWPVGNTQSGGAYFYLGFVNTHVGSTWTTAKSTIGGEATGGASGYVSGQFTPGTAYIRPLLLLNRARIADAGGPGLGWTDPSSNHRWSSVSLRQVTVHDHDAEYVNLGGDTMTGSLAVSDSLQVSGTFPSVTANYDAGYGGFFRLKRAGADRWLITTRNYVEGSGSGSDLRIARCGDDGTANPTDVLLVSRSTGNATFGGEVRAPRLVVAAAGTGAPRGWVAGTDLGGNPITGHIVITLPRMQATMLGIKVSGYNYNPWPGEWEMNIGGYAYPPGGGSWAGTSAWLRGLDGATGLVVGYWHKNSDNTRADFAITIGWSTTNFYYPDINVEVMTAGHNGKFEAIDGNWSVTVSNSMAGWTQSGGYVQPQRVADRDMLRPLPVATYDTTQRNLAVGTANWVWSTGITWTNTTKFPMVVQFDHSGYLYFAAGSGTVAGGGGGGADLAYLESRIYSGGTEYEHSKVRFRTDFPDPEDGIWYVSYHTSILGQVAAGATINSSLWGYHNGQSDGQVYLNYSTYRAFAIGPA